MLSETDQRAAIDAIGQAAFNPSAWSDALRWITKAGGGWCSHILGVSPKGVQFNIAHEIPPEINTEFERRGGGDTAINPRANILIQRPFVLMRDHNVTSAERIARSEFYQDFLYQCDSAEMIGASLPIIDKTVMCVAVIQSERQRGADIDSKVLGRLFRAVHDAMRTSYAIDNRGADFLHGTLTGLEFAALVVDRLGRIVSLTPRAEDVVRCSDLLRLRSGYVEAADASCDAALQSAIALACIKPGLVMASQTNTISLKSLSGGTVIADVAPLAISTFSMRFGPVAVVILRPKKAASVAGQLRAVFGLSSSEAQIAEQLIAGKSLAHIAHQRSVSTATVRAQLRSVFSKTGTHRQTELVAILNRTLAS